MGGRVKCGRPVGVHPGGAAVTLHEQLPEWPPDRGYPAERQSPSSVARCGRHRGGARARGSHGAPSGGFSARDLAVTQVFSSEPAGLLVVVCVVIGLGVGVEQGEFSELPSGTGGGEDVVSADEGRGVG